MKFNPRSFPHPVLGSIHAEIQDITGSAFQANVNYDIDNRCLYLSAEFILSNRTLSEMVAKGEASYVVYVDCINAFFRESFTTSNTTWSESIMVDQLRGQVGVDFFLCVEKDVELTHLDGAHPDYEGIVFQLSKGDIVAYDVGYIIHVGDKDSLRKISAIMKVVRGVTEDLPMSLNFEDEQIQIVLCVRDFQRYNQLQGSKKMVQTLLATIVMPALVEGLARIRESGEDPPEGRWAEVLERKRDEVLAKHPLSDTSNYTELANLILENNLFHSLLELEHNISFDSEPE